MGDFGVPDDLLTAGSGFAGVTDLLWLPLIIANGDLAGFGVIVFGVKTLFAARSRGTGDAGESDT